MGKTFRQRLRTWLISQYGELCFYCSSAPAAEIEHVDPAGPTKPDNIVFACKTCNASKSDDPVTIFLDRLKDKIEMASWSATTTAVISLKHRQKATVWDESLKNAARSLDLERERDRIRGRRTVSDRRSASMIKQGKR